MLTPSALKAYYNSLVDPFDTTITQPKLLDGDVERTSGVRLRSTGTITCRTGGQYTYIAVIPAFSNAICWFGENSLDPGTVADKTPAAFSNHVDSVANRALIHQMRIVGNALRLSLLNSAEENDGMWEAARVTFKGTPSADPVDNRIHYPLATLEAFCIDMANNPTYETGKLRDIHRHQFKTGFRSASEMSWGSASAAVMGASNDVVIIRIAARTVASSPSVLMYDSVSCQEVEYHPGTQLHRLMTYNEQVNDFNEMLLGTNYRKASIRYR